MEIVIDQSLAEAIRRRAADAGYPNTDAYVEAVVRADLSRVDVSSIEPPWSLSPETQAAIQTGLESGPGIVADEAFWTERLARLVRRSVDDQGDRFIRGSRRYRSSGIPRSESRLTR